MGRAEGGSGKVRKTCVLFHKGAWCVGVLYPPGAVSVGREGCAALRVWCVRGEALLRARLSGFRARSRRLRRGAGAAQPSAAHPQHASHSTARPACTAQAEKKISVSGSACLVVDGRHQAKPSNQPTKQQTKKKKKKHPCLVVDGRHHEFDEVDLRAGAAGLVAVAHGAAWRAGRAGRVGGGKCEPTLGTPRGRACPLGSLLAAALADPTDCL